MGSVERAPHPPEAATGQAAPRRVLMIKARHPVAIFANGFGDCLLALPALRALASIFRGWLTLISQSGVGHVFFSDLPLRSLHECEMRQRPQGGRSSTTGGLPAPSRGATSSFP